MQLFLHKCLTLVRSTGIEDFFKARNPFIYKGCSVWTPQCAPKIFRKLNEYFYSKVDRFSCFSTIYLRFFIF